MKKGAGAAGFVGGRGAGPGSGSGRARSRSRGWLEQLGELATLGEPVPEERLVGGVLQQTADQVGHAGDQLPHGGVHPDPLPQAAQGGVDGLGHPVEQLQLDRPFGQSGGPGRSQAVGQGAQVVAGEGGADLPGVLHQVAGAALVVGVGLGLALEDGHGPALGLGHHRFEIPVGALHQADLQRRGQRRARPGHQVPQVGEGVLAVGLHHAAQGGAARKLRPDGPQQLEGDVLHIVVLGVDVDGGRHLPGPQKDGAQAGQRLVDPLRPGEGGEAGRQGGGLDGDVDPGEVTPGVGLQAGTAGPGGAGRGQGLEHGGHPVGVAVSLGRGDRLLAQQIHGGGLPRLPQRPQPRQRLGGRLAGDELAGQAGDVAPGRGRRHPRPERHPTGEAQAQLERGRGLAAPEVLLQVAHDIVVVPAGGEDVDETEQLRLEPGVGHGPLEELLAPPGAAEDARLLRGAGLSDAAGQCLNLGFGGSAHPPRGYRRSVSAPATVGRKPTSRRSAGEAGHGGVGYRPAAGGEEVEKEEELHDGERVAALLAASVEPAESAGQDVVGVELPPDGFLHLSGEGLLGVGVTVERVDRFAVLVAHELEVHGRPGVVGEDRGQIGMADGGAQQDIGREGSATVSPRSSIGANRTTMSALDRWGRM